MRILILLTLLSGCSVERPANQPADPPLGADEAEALVLAAWTEALLPDARGRALSDPPPILWFEGDCLDYSDDSFCETGRTSTVPGDVEIHILARPRASETALAHELLHWALHETGCGWDGGHEEGEWDLVIPLQWELYDAGL